MVGAGAVRELLQLLGSSQASWGASHDCAMLLSDLLESAITLDAAGSDQLSDSDVSSAALLAAQMAEDDGLACIVRHLRHSDPKVPPA